VALIAEGPTDAVIIQAALKALLPGPFVMTTVQPEPTRPRLGAGWGGVLRWCRDFAAGGYRRFEDDPKLSLFNLFVVHVDADVADKRYADISEDIAEQARQAGWAGLPQMVPCPPAADGADVVRSCVLAWTGLAALGPRTVLCVPSKATEAWLAAAVLDEGHALLTELECRADLEARLAALPKKQRIAKSTKGYRDHERTVTAAWSAVRMRCTQAERFSRDIAAAVP
jgi:hypothetical protein